MTLADNSFTSVYSAALQGNPCRVVGLGDDDLHLPVTDWTQEADADDRQILRHCAGPTLDIGCGPGRMAAALAEMGQPVLGIDVVHEAVGQTRGRGVSALRLDVFGDLPGEGRWQTALLADGNVGIGGDPVALLRRVRELLAADGAVVVELEAPGVEASATWVALEVDGTQSRPFRWAVLGVDDIDRVAREAGWEVATVHRIGSGRWVAILVAPR